MIAKERAKQLMAERTKIDQQLASLLEVLKSNNVDMDSPLVDNEGYPIAELDILSIRKARHSIICLTNDRKKMTDEIERLLIEMHELLRIESSSPMDENTSISNMVMEHDGEKPTVHRTTNRPFLQVENVVYGSPAYDAGLLIDDFIIQCGSMHADNFVGLQQFSELVSQHKPLNITVLRKTTVHRLTAYPGRWEGIGMFGARVMVVKENKN